MKKLLIGLIISIEILVLTKSVSAYLFPGTAAQLIGSLWPLILAFFMTICAFLVKIFWKPIKKGISKIRPKNKKEQIPNKEPEEVNLTSIKPDEDNNQKLP